MSVLDASAILALLQNEPGADRVAQALDDAVISAVNYSEVMAKLAEKGMKAEDRRKVSNALTCEVIAFDTDLAESAAALRPLSKSLGLSFADRACLALAQAMNVPAITADRAWARLEADITVNVIR